MVDTGLKGFVLKSRSENLYGQVKKGGKNRMVQRIDGKHAPKGWFFFQAHL